MRAILHVPINDNFDFEKYVCNSLWPLHPFPELLPNERKIKNKHIRDKVDDNPYTLDGKHWTWVTNRGNAIRLDDSKEDDSQRKVIVELNSRRSLPQKRDNGVGVLIYHLEKLSTIKRTKWEVKDLHSSIDLDWFQVKYSRHVRDNRLSRDSTDPFRNVIMKEVIERRIVEAYNETSVVTSDIIEDSLIQDYGSMSVELSKRHIQYTLANIKTKALVKQNNLDELDKGNALRFLSKYIEESSMKYVHNLLASKYEML